MTDNELVEEVNRLLFRYDNEAGFGVRQFADAVEAMLARAEHRGYSRGFRDGMDWIG